MVSSVELSRQPGRSHPDRGQRRQQRVARRHLLRGEGGHPVPVRRRRIRHRGRYRALHAELESEAAIAGLTNGTAYTFTVAATNATGDSPVSATSAPVVPATTPGKVSRFSVMVRGTVAVTAWSAPANGGTAITGYRVTVNEKARSVGDTTHKLVLKKLKPGVYKVQVAARNALGYGRSSVTAKFRVK